MEKTKTMDDTEIRVNEIEALNKALGPAAALRFLTLPHHGPTEQPDERELRSQLRSAAEVVFAKLWENKEDEVWNEYLEEVQG